MNIRTQIICSSLLGGAAVTFLAGITLWVLSIANQNLWVARTTSIPLVKQTGAIALCAEDLAQSLGDLIDARYRRNAAQHNQINVLVAKRFDALDSAIKVVQQEDFRSTPCCKNGAVQIQNLAAKLRTNWQKCHDMDLGDRQWPLALQLDDDATELTHIAITAQDRAVRLMDDRLSSADSFVRWLIGIWAVSAILFLVIVVIAGTIFASRLARRLGRIQSQAESVAAGNLSTALEVVGNDEIDVVAVTFNDMVKALNSSRKTLVESERLIRSTLNSLMFHIAIVDDAGDILAINVNSASRSFADENALCVQVDGVGMNYFDVCDRAASKGNEYGSDVAVGIRSIIKLEQSSFALEYTCGCPGELQWFLVRATPFDGDGATRVVIVHENITSRKTAERLASEQRGLQEAVAGMEQVLGVVGHELRTPLAAVRAISEFLTTDGARSAPEADAFLHSINQEVIRMSDTVSNLLEAARLNSGRAKWNWDDVNLNDVIADAVQSIKPLVDSSRVAIQTHIDGQSDLIRGDAEALRRLILNLLSNAVKHTVSGKIVVSASFVTSDLETWAEVVIADTGSGIPPELVSRLGEAFALNAGVVGANHVSGTGLGLAICKGVAAAHGGQISFSSVQGIGTTVTVRIRTDLTSAATGDTEYSNELEEVGI